MLKPPTKSSEDYTVTAIGTIFAIRPIVLKFPRPIGMLASTPALDSHGHYIPKPLYRCLIPICPENFCGEIAEQQIVHELVRTFWQDLLLPKIPRLDDPPQWFVYSKIILQIIRQTESRGIALPYGMEYWIDFDGPKATHDVFHEIYTDEDTIRRIYDFWSRS
jgi:hypothetical protein